MSNRIYTHDAKLNDQVVTWMARIESEKIDPSSMSSMGAAEYMRLYCEQCITDGDVIAELARQCPDPKKFRLEITIVDRVNSSLEFTVDEPSATYDNALATFKDAVKHIDGLGWIDVKPTLEWVPVEEDDDTACANGKDVIEEMFPVIAGWETENPKTGRMLPSKVTFSRECFETLRNEIKSAEYTLGVQHKQNVEEPLREELERLREENKALKEERKELRSRLCKEVGRYNNQETRHEQELEVTRNSWTVLLDICDNPRLPTDTEEQVAMSVARNVLHGEKLDIECFKDLAREKGLVLSTILVEGIKRG